MTSPSISEGEERVPEYTPTPTHTTYGHHGRPFGDCQTNIELNSLPPRLPPSFEGHKSARFPVKVASFDPLKTPTSMTKDLSTSDIHDQEANNVSRVSRAGRRGRNKFRIGQRTRRILCFGIPLLIVLLGLMTFFVYLLLRYNNKHSAGGAQSGRVEEELVTELAVLDGELADLGRNPEVMAEDGVSDQTGESGQMDAVPKDSESGMGVLGDVGGKSDDAYPGQSGDVDASLIDLNADLGVLSAQLGRVGTGSDDPDTEPGKFDSKTDDVDESTADESTAEDSTADGSTANEM